MVSLSLKNLALVFLVNLRPNKALIFSVNLNNRTHYLVSPTIIIKLKTKNRSLLKIIIHSNKLWRAVICSTNLSPKITFSVSLVEVKIYSINRKVNHHYLATNKTIIKLEEQLYFPNHKFNKIIKDKMMKMMEKKKVKMVLFTQTWMKLKMEKWSTTIT